MDKTKKAFTVIELLVVIAIIMLLSSLVFIMLNNYRAKARDAQRVAEVDSLRKSLEIYYSTNNKYPDTSDWVKIEEDNAGNGPFSQAIKPYISQVPKDPLYPQVDGTKIYSYQYKSVDDGQDYKVHVEMETGAYASYEVYSGGGSEITYGGGGGSYAPPAGFALQFDGGDDFVKVLDSPDLNATTTLTLEAWVKSAVVGAAPDYRTIVGKQKNGVPQGGYELITDVDQSDLMFHLQLVGGLIFSTVILTPDIWHHIIGTYDTSLPSDNMKLYVDGLLVDKYNKTAQIGIIAKDLYFGGDPINNSAATAEFKGMIDEVRIYNRAISSTEAQEHCNGVFNNESGLVGLWHFDEGAGASTADSSGKGHNGVLFNGPQWVSSP